MSDLRAVSCRLSELVGALPSVVAVDGPVDAEVSAVVYDSRAVEPGALFVAIPGLKTDGRLFIPDALARGAAAVVAEAPAAAAGAPVVLVEDARAALPHLAAAFEGHPSRRLRVIGVTGTDGKTTTTYLIAAVLRAGGLVCGRLGTVDFDVAGTTEVNLSRQTTPEAPEVQALLRRMAGAGCSHAIVESTSHGLALHRLDAIEYDVAVLTNLTSDHLDFHPTQADYVAAKRRLFEKLDDPTAKRGRRYAVLNADDAVSKDFANASSAPPVTYGLRAPADVSARDVRLLADGSAFTLVAPQGTASVRTWLPAEFNVYNALAAAAVGLNEGLSLQEVAAGLGSLAGVPGRMERVDAGQAFSVVVDYAHTRESVEKALRVLREVTEGRLIVVFGCAGERDRARRTGVGGAAARLADYAVVTSEDPRTEDPEAIIEEIAGVLRGHGRMEGKDFERHEDRREAIAAAFRTARPGDTVLLAGKGHEQSMIYGTEKRPWDDRRVAREELARLGWERP